jgi:hypothetical protein
MSTREFVIHLMLISEVNNMKHFDLQAITTSCTKDNNTMLFFGLSFHIFPKKIKSYCLDCLLQQCDHWM